jgi:hypothetical protein
MSFGALGDSVLGDSAFDTAGAPKFNEPPPKTSSFGDDFDELDGGFDGKKKKKRKEPLDDLDDDFGGGKKKKFKEPVDDDLDSGDIDVFKPKKGFPFAAIAAVIVLLALAGGGYYYLTYMRGADSGDAAAVSAEPTPETPAVSTESSQASAGAGEAADIPVTTIEVQTPKPVAYAPSKPEKNDKKADTKSKPAPSTPYPAPSYSTPAYSAPSYQAPAPAAPAYSAPAYTPPPEPAPPPPPPKVEQVIVTSNPSGATVEVDGKRVGTTPYTINRPPWGDLNIAVSMNGYEKMTKTVEFEGGTLNVPFNLSKASVAAPPPAPAPAYAPPPPAASTPPPPPPAAAARPAAPPTAAGASIFIATLPPKADVYVGGKLVGTTNEGELQVPVGTHQVKFVKDGVEKTETITFNPGKNPTRFVNLK